MLRHSQFLEDRQTQNSTESFRRWEDAAQILESLRFIAVHGPDPEGLEVELAESISQLLDPLFPVVTHNHTCWELEDPVGRVFPGVTVVPFEIP